MHELIFSIVYLWTFYALYVFTMGVYRAKLAGRLAGFTLYLLYPFVLVAAVADVVCQLTIASIVFFELPHTCWQSAQFVIFGREIHMTYLYIEPLVTTRLKRHHGSNNGWRTRLSAFVCENLLDPFDPTGDHC